MTAAERPIPNRGAGSDHVYRRHGLPPVIANARRQAGIPATVAKAFKDTPAEGHLPLLAATFSVTGLRALSDRNLSATDLTVLFRLAAVNPATLRGYVSQTRLRVSEIDWMMERGISCQSTLTWTRRLPHASRDINLVSVLNLAVVLHGVPDEDLSGWVRFTNRHRIMFSGEPHRTWQFLGGDTALMAMAGVSPPEADQMVRNGPVDRDALSMLAGLRAGARGNR